MEIEAKKKLKMSGKTLVFDEEPMTRECHAKAKHTINENERSAKTGKEKNSATTQKKP